MESAAPSPFLEVPEADWVWANALCFAEDEDAERACRSNTKAAGDPAPQLLFHIGGEIKRDRHSEVSSWRVKPRRKVYTAVHYLVKGPGTIRWI